MAKLTSIALGAGLALASIVLAHADPSTATGAWKLSVGVNDDPCLVTLTADPAVETAGSASATGDCNGVAFQHWKETGTKLQLEESNGTLVASLHAKDGAWEGKTVADSKQVALNR
jgi:heat shock protein HslJ